MKLFWLTILCVLLAILLPPLAQPQSYHAFIDSRTLLGIPNFWNVASNLAFLIVGFAGIVALTGKRGAARFIDSRERWPYLAFFVAIALTALGSGYYHLAPDDARLVWDRLPIALACAAFSVALIGDHWGPRATRALIPALAIGAATVGWWQYTQQRGVENLIPYFVLQAYAMVVALDVLLFESDPPRYTHRRDLWVMLSFWVLARAAEWVDAGLYAGGAFLSGHTVKHLMAALAAAWLLRMILRRKAATNPL